MAGRARLLKVDFHCHTYHSKDSLTSIPALIQAARNKGLNRLVVTDHNLLAGAREAFNLAPDLIIIGEEVQTTQGEFLAAFVTEEVPRGLEPLEALKRLKDQGAFISVSHPFDPQRSGWHIETLAELAPRLDAVEVLNARVFNQAHNDEALAFAHAHGLSGTAGSDGHHPSEIGQAYLELRDFTDAASLRVAVGQARVCGALSSPWVHFYSSWARVEKAFRSQK
jgi:predicted metal-dependent phosphoesterase TrpH